jgi:hypothetical protein
MTTPKPTPRVEREARLRWVPIASMRVTTLAQRELNQARVDHLAATFDLEQVGTPTVNERGGHFWVIDGQHRVAALVDMGWGDQQIQCWTYVGLTEEEEAEKFLKLNDVLAVQALPKFRIAVKAGREVETDIDRIVRAAGLRVTADKGDGAIRAVGTLGRIYKRSGPAVLARTLRVVRDAYGDPGLEAAVIDGVGHVVGRYDGQLQDPHAIEKLAGVHGGVGGLLGQADVLRRQTGSPRSHCVAAIAVDVINRGLRGGERLPSWWTPATNE